MLWLCAGYLYLNLQDGRRLSESQSDHLARSGEPDGWLCRAEYLAKTSFEIVLEYFR